MARFITTSINLPKVEDSLITMIRSGSKLYSICEFQGMHRAYFYWQIEFNDTFPIKVKGLNRPQIDITPWDGKAFRVRLTVTHRGQSRYLEADHRLAEASEALVPELVETVESQDAAMATTEQSASAPVLNDEFGFDEQARDSLITSVATRFRANLNQDLAHNAILTFLLNSLTQMKEEHKPAYAALKRGLSHPLYHTRKASGLTEVKDSEFFIRDFLMLHTQGGESARDPIMLEGLNIRDGAIDSLFAEEFDLLVDEINDQNADEDLRYDVDYFAQLAHRDGLQLIPKAASINQFMGAVMSHVTVEGNTIESTGALQGIFASDGAFRNLQIINNRIRTAGVHSVSIAGMLSGAISDNIISSSAGTANKATLHPLRIGGGANIKVLSFVNQPGILKGDDNYYEYEPIQGNQAIEDLRSVRPEVSRGSATYWRDVDMVKLQALYPATYERVKQLTSWPHEIPREWEKMMQQVGTKV